MHRKASKIERSIVELRLTCSVGKEIVTPKMLNKSALC
jgi:hypothetical protein